MSLNLVHQVHLQSLPGLILCNLVDFNGTWLIVFTNTCKECFTVMGHANLWENVHRLIWFSLIVVPNLLVAAYTEDFMLSVWNVGDTSHLDGLLGEILVHESIWTVLLIDQIPEEHSTSIISRYKSHIIVEPIDWLNSLHVTLALEMRRVLSSIEVVHIDSVISICSCEQMPTVTELNLMTVLLLNILELVKRFWKHIH